jgi:hypothetical protein
MSESDEQILSIENPSYGPFKGFKVRFVGFEKLPYRFSNYGWGGGKPLLEKLADQFGEFDLVIDNNKVSSVCREEGRTEIVLNYNDLLNIRHDYWRRSKLCGEEAITQGLRGIFPDEFGERGKVLAEIPEELKAITPSRDEIARAIRVLPFVRKWGLRDDDVLQLTTGQNVLHYVNLESVLGEFEKRLNKESSESEWQGFFKKNLVILHPGYIRVIEKSNVSLGKAELPDFLMLSVEGYIDVHEIKLPKTKLLNYDDSHNNYYWSGEISKAIAQIESYLDALSRNKYALEREIEKRYELKVTILRPRGYIIAGHSNQFVEPIQSDYFRLLNESLSNTRILPYDTFLQIFKNLSKALQEMDQTT